MQACWLPLSTMRECKEVAPALSSLAQGCSPGLYIPAGCTLTSRAIRQRHGWQQRSSRGAPKSVYCTHSKAATRGGMHLQVCIGPVLAALRSTSFLIVYPLHGSCALLYSDSSLLYTAFLNAWLPCRCLHSSLCWLSSAAPVALARML